MAVRAVFRPLCWPAAAAAAERPAGGLIPECDPEKSLGQEKKNRKRWYESFAFSSQQVGWGFQARLAGRPGQAALRPPGPAIVAFGAGCFGCLAAWLLWLLLLEPQVPCYCSPGRADETGFLRLGGWLLPGRLASSTLPFAHSLVLILHPLYLFLSPPLLCCSSVHSHPTQTHN